MKRFALAALLAAFTGTALAVIIPADRLTDWTPGTVVGVPGGIPNRVTIGATVAANTVTVRAYNVGAIGVDPASATYRATVHKF